MKVSLMKMLCRLLLTFAVLAGPGNLAAQNSPAGQISVSGVVDIKHAAELLRVQVELTGKGKDLKEALAKLNEKKDLAVAQLVNLGAAKGDVVLSDPNTLTERNDRQRQMEMMMMMRRGGAKKPDAKNKQPDPVVVSATLKADLKLKAGSPEELLLSGHTLQEKVKAADLGGSKENEKLSPKDEELAEEMQEMNRVMAESGEPRRGEPTFQYVYKIPKADYDKALKDAFTKASAQAGLLARAAGVELGSLHSLQSMASATPNDPYAEYYSRMGRTMTREEDTGNTDTMEAVGSNPVKVSLKVVLNAAFQIKQK